MKTTHQWANELPRIFRQEVRILIPDSCQNLNSIGTAIYHFITKLEDAYAVHEWAGRSRDWDELARKYTRGEDKTYHVSYWTAKNKSVGDNVQAFSAQHAIDIVLARTGKSEDQIIYVHCKDSEFKENSEKV